MPPTLRANSHPVSSRFKDYSINTPLSPLSQNGSHGHAPSSSASSSLFSIGNLFLSSCPGKKVRLSGPVKGRSAVCRDLKTDLTRMKSMGVRCIVCCLDDNELEFLGASWPEYSAAANSVGLDVLRLPTPEGLAPLTPAALDAHLTRIIQSYTLAGSNILVHCRGGVGRAGLVACCWMLKLGLCGWIETDPQSTAVRRDTMQLVERVISVVRRRRSMKAVETYEQVRFLVEYVDFLRLSASL
ncbi:hypothetical protein PLICRDRAFT_103890 [Plicaturopsis crispa FD-325 SS-3]|nr:hypothetical protein PLICRDRAFT_103890 [Plicaturopsis crispa FD-325 SS-3]